MVSWWRFFGCAVGFGFGVMWMTAGIGSAVLALLCAAFGYGVVFVAEHERAGLSRLSPANEPTSDESTPMTLAELELDRYEQRMDVTAPLTAEVEYGWPRS